MGQGTHSRSTISDFFGVGEERRARAEFVFDADHPAVLVGQDNGPTPVEFLLHALASCLTAGLANIAAARKVTLTEVRSTVSGDIDLNGILGLNPEVRNGYQQIRCGSSSRATPRPKCSASIVEQSRSRSAVYDVITNGVPVDIDVDVDMTGPCRPDLSRTGADQVAWPVSTCDQPSSDARRAASRRVLTSSFVSTAARWCSAVRWDTTSRSAISALVRPPATRRQHLELSICEARRVDRVDSRLALRHP